MNLLYLLFPLTSILLFIALIIVGRLNYKIYYGTAFSFLNLFPFEMNDKPRMKMNILFRLLLSLFAFSFCGPFIFMFGSYQDILIKTIIAFATVLSLSMMSIFMIDMRFYKAHISAAAIFFILSIAFDFLVGYVYLVIVIIPTYQAFPYIMFGSSFIKLLLILNPKLAKWMIITVNEKGEASRPRICSLVLTEWIFVILNILSLILCSTGIM
ncbi:MAG: hypothetical protein HUJ61_02115 [Bacilli bacterium]|nr:hypothetical protein [Bacilli bacterium]